MTDIPSPGSRAVKYAIVAVAVIAVGYAAWRNAGTATRIRPVATVAPTRAAAPSYPAGWVAATDPGSAAAFAYPPNIGTTYISATDWPPKIQIDPKPFDCIAAGTALERAGGTAPRTIGGRAYCVTETSGGAAGSVYTQYAYAFPENGKTAILTFSLRFVQCGNYPEPRKTACEKERAAFSADSLADGIARTVSIR